MLSLVSILVVTDLRFPNPALLLLCTLFVRAQGSFVTTGCTEWINPSFPSLPCHPFRSSHSIPSMPSLDTTPSFHFAVIHQYCSTVSHSIISSSFVGIPGFESQTSGEGRRCAAW